MESPLNAPPTYDDPLEDDFKFDTVVSGCELSLRQAFIRKVYFLLFLQLLVTGAIISLVSFNETVKSFALNNFWLFLTSMVSSVGFLIAAYVQSRSYPVNLIYLFGFTISEGYMLGVATCLYDTNVVLEAFAITLVIFVGLSLFACQTNYDFISWLGVLNVLLFAMIGISFMWFFFQPSSTAEMIYSCIGALVFSGYILVDTQLILRRFNLEEEVPAAISVYLDVINLFLNILRILAQMDNDN